MVSPLFFDNSATINNVEGEVELHYSNKIYVRNAIPLLSMSILRVIFGT